MRAESCHGFLVWRNPDGKDFATELVYHPLGEPHSNGLASWLAIVGDRVKTEDTNFLTFMPVVSSSATSCLEVSLADARPCP